MNPDKNKRRGCYIEVTDKQRGIYTVVDYPTYTYNKYGMIVEGQNLPIPDDKPYKKEFKSKQEAYNFCQEQNYVICDAPGTGIKYVPEVEDEDEIED